MKNDFVEDALGSQEILREELKAAVHLRGLTFTKIAKEVGLRSYTLVRFCQRVGRLNFDSACKIKKWVDAQKDIS